MRELGGWRTSADLLNSLETAGDARPDLPFEIGGQDAPGRARSLGKKLSEGAGRLFLVDGETLRLLRRKGSRNRFLYGVGKPVDQDAEIGEQGGL